jgi:hypothetical protein
VLDSTPICSKRRRFRGLSRVDFWKIRYKAKASGRLESPLERPKIFFTVEGTGRARMLEQASRLNFRLSSKLL